MQLRKSNIRELGQEIYDVLIVGGGINGAASAAALSGKGVRVALIDQRDFAGFTSQSRPTWFAAAQGLENHGYVLVRKLCLAVAGRATLLGSGDSVFRQHRQGVLLSSSVPVAGRLVYWFFGSGFTQTPRCPGRSDGEEPVVKTQDLYGGFEYSDAYLHDNDSRFVFQFVRTAMDRGCRGQLPGIARRAPRGRGLDDTRGMCCRERLWKFVPV